MYKLHVKEIQKCMRHAMIPKYILIPNLGFLPKIIFRYALGSTLLELKPEVKITVTWKQLVTRQGPRRICYHNTIDDLLWVHFFQDLTPEIKVTVAENSKQQSMTPTYIHKLNLVVNMSYNMRYALTLCFACCR